MYGISITMINTIFREIIIITMSSSIPPPPPPPPSSSSSSQEENSSESTTNHSDTSQLSRSNVAVVISQIIPVLPGQTSTQSDHEDYLANDIDGLIFNFLSHFNGRHPYSAVLRWTRDDLSNPQYSVAVVIHRPGNPEH